MYWAMSVWLFLSKVTDHKSIMFLKVPLKMWSRTGKLSAGYLAFKNTTLLSKQREESSIDLLPVKVKKQIIKMFNCHSSRQVLVRSQRNLYWHLCCSESNLNIYIFVSKTHFFKIIKVKNLCTNRVIKWQLEKQCWQMHISKLHISKC